MNPEKAELKILVANDIGATIEDSLEAAGREMQRQEGAVTAFAQAAKACEMLCEVVNKDLDEGKITSMELAEAAKLWLTRAANAQRNLGRQAENLVMAASGKVAALESAVAIIAKYRHAEQLKVAAARVLETETPAAAPAVEVRPGMSIKERRQLEERAATTPPTSELPVVEKRRAAKKRSSRAYHS